MTCKYSTMKSEVWMYHLLSAHAKQILQIVLFQEEKNNFISGLKKTSCTSMKTALSSSYWRFTKRSATSWLLFPLDKAQLQMETHYCKSFFAVLNNLFSKSVVEKKGWSFHGVGMHHDENK